MRFVIHLCDGNLYIKVIVNFQITDYLSYKNVISIITPTYNRAETLHRCYESLSEQSFRNFEWIIVDDGSVDEISENVRAWQRESER